MACAFTQVIWNNYDYGHSKKIKPRFSIRPVEWSFRPHPAEWKISDKFKYVYLLTPQGIAEKVALTSRFLRRKIEEYEVLKVEIKALKSEVDATGNDGKQKA